MAAAARVNVQLVPDVCIEGVARSNSTPMGRAAMVMVQVCQDWKRIIYADKVLWEMLTRNRFPRAVALVSVLGPPPSWEKLYHDHLKLHFPLPPQPPSSVLADFAFSIELYWRESDELAASFVGILEAAQAGDSGGVLAPISLWNETPPWVDLDAEEETTGHPSVVFEQLGLRCFLTWRQNFKTIQLFDTEPGSDNEYDEEIVFINFESSGPPDPAMTFQPVLYLNDGELFGNMFRDENGVDLALSDIQYYLSHLTNTTLR